MPILRTFVVNMILAYVAGTYAFAGMDIAPAELDPIASRAYIADVAVASKAQNITGIFAANSGGDGWMVELPPGSKSSVTFLLALKQPVEIGSIQFAGSVKTLSVLKADAAGAPDPANAAQWQEIVVPPNQSGAAMVPLPIHTITRALLLTDPHPWDRASLRFVRCFASRMANITPLALAYAQSTYTEFNEFSSPTVHSPDQITKGTGYWQNAGKDGFGHIPRAPISDLDPAWFILSWDEAQTIRALWLADNFEQVRIEAYNGPKDLNPRAGTDADWEAIRDQTPVPSSGRFISFPPITTRGIRLTILKSYQNQIAKIDGVHALVDLKPADSAVIAAPSISAEPPPVSVPYQLDADGETTMVINGPDGRRVRNLFARRNQTKGTHEAPWDLKDEQGRVVPPGDYQWKAISHPPLALKYEMTVYPNVAENSPENPPWITSAGGSGGWLADHTSNVSGAANGSYVFFGSPVAESGVSLICCDLTGRKLWAIASFAGFTGAYHIAADEKNVYVSAPGGALHLDPRAEVVWTVDIATHRVSELARLKPDSKRQRGITSMAVRDGKLYIAVRAQEDWFASSASADDVDIENCTPRYAAARGPRYNYEVVPDPRGDFLRLFRLTGTPPGGHTLTYIESTPGKSPRRQVVLLFNKPIPIGSAVYPQPDDPKIKVKLSFLKPQAACPPNPGDPSVWQPFQTQGKLAWDVAVAPPNTKTRALRITFSRGEAADDDLLSGDDSAEFKVGAQDKNPITLKDPDKEKDDGTAGLGGDTAGSWIGKLEGLKILNRRFENVAALATIEVNSGKIAADGSWDAQRKTALSDTDPGIYTMKWNEPQALRGLAIKEVDGKRTEIDVYTGSDDKPVDTASPTAWKHISTYVQSQRDYYWPDPNNNIAARYLDGYVDFGDIVKTRAVRLRVCEQWLDTALNMKGPRFDVGGKLDSTRCRIFGVAAMKYIGGEEPVDSRSVERVETLDCATGKVEADIAVNKPAAIAFDQQGNMFGISGNTLARIDPANGVQSPIVTADLQQPRTFAIDKAGNFYIYDHEPTRKNIRVYSPAGKFLHMIGTPGGYRVGPWDPNRFQDVTAMAIDAQQQLWVVDNTWMPKRISLWTLDGEWQKDFLGNTVYGGGGVLDPKDKTRVFYGPLEFAVDWTTGHTHLKNLTWLGDGTPGEVPIYVNGHTYLVTRGPGPTQECGEVYIYETDHIRRVAAMGHASAFAPLRRPELQAQLGTPVLNDCNFVWSDRNGDGIVQADEVMLRPRIQNDDENVTRFNDDLSIQSQCVRLQVKGFYPSGAPIYEVERMPGLTGRRNTFRLNDGNFTVMDDKINGLFAPDGKAIWTYPNEGLTTFALSTASPYTPEQVVCEFGWVGHETADAGDLGEFTVANTNIGVWNIWTADGLLAGSIWGDQRLPGMRGWSMPEHNRGMSLDMVTPGQEHFQGYFCKTSDHHYYAIAGHNHLSLVEVLGMDGFKRSSGRLVVKPQDVVKTESWAHTQQRQKVYQRTPVLDLYRTENPPPIDGNVSHWDTLAADFGAKDKERITHGALFRAAWDDKNLYVCYEVRGLGPLKNTGEQWDRLFKTGASVDLQIGVDPAAPRNRAAPVIGDKRLLLSYAGNRPIAVLYDAVVTGTPQDKAWKAVSPVGQVSFDRVVELENVRMARGASDDAYVLEAAIPLETLGLKPADDMRIKLDWGVLASDAGGNAVLQRLYWSNGATGIVADVPSEAMLHPDLWGYALFHDRSRHAEVPTHILPSKDGDSPAVKKPSAKDVERELNGDK